MEFKDKVKEFLEVATASMNPDDYTDLEEILNKYLEA